MVEEVNEDEVRNVGRGDSESRIQHDASLYLFSRVIKYIISLYYTITVLSVQIIAMTCFQNVSANSRNNY